MTELTYLGNNRYNIDSPDEFNTQVVVLIYITKYSEYESVPQKNHESNQHKQCSFFLTHFICLEVEKPCIVGLLVESYACTSPHKSTSINKIIRLHLQKTESLSFPSSVWSA